MSVRRWLLAIALLAAAAPVRAGIPALPEIPLLLPDSVRQPLIARRQPLAQRKLALIAEGDAITASCARLKRGSAEHQHCLSRLAQFDARVETLRDEVDRLADAIDAAIVANTIAAMNSLAKRLGWSAEELARLDKALNGLSIDGDAGATDIQIRSAWQAVLARNDGEFARHAAAGAGPGYAGAGRQTQYEDCAIFALANAAGLPYGVAAARAARLIGEGEWRDAAARANPQQAIERGGLTGGEVVMLAEAFGEVEVVRSADFPKVLGEGRPVMINVVPVSGDVNKGHEVVLSKTFQQGGETWYEMMDSNQGPSRRLYLTARELQTVLQENGVAFRPEAGTTPRLLR